MSFETTQHIDSQNGDSTLNLSLHEIRLPYPPPFVTVSDFINKRESSARIFRKSPNAFFIYRKAFTNYLTLLNYKLTMIDVSKFVSNRWKGESNEVKEAYIKIAKEIDVELKEKRKHDNKCPVIWKTDKKSKKQKRKSKKILTNNNNENNDFNNSSDINNNNDKNNSLNKFRNTTTTTTTTTAGVTFEFQNFSIPDNENNQKNLRSLERIETSQSPQSSLENSPNTIPYPLINLSGIIPPCNFVNYDISCESPSNESEEDNMDCHPTYNLNNCDQMLEPIYCSRLNTIESHHQIHANSQSSEYENFVYSFHNNGLFPQYGWDPCINAGNLTCQQVNQLQ